MSDCPEKFSVFRFLWNSRPGCSTLTSFCVGCVLRTIYSEELAGSARPTYLFIFYG